MDSVLGSVWMVGVVLMSSGLALVGLTQETSEPVYLETRSLVWGDGHGRQVGDVVEVEHVHPPGARVLVSYDGGRAMVQLDRGDRLWLPCPTGADEWVTFSAAGRVVEQRRVTGCSPQSMGEPPQDASAPSDGSTAERPVPTCPGGTVLPDHRAVELALRVCVPAVVADR